MDKLLTAVLDAHGGLQNWAKVTREAFNAARLALGPHLSRSHPADRYLFATVSNPRGV
jgi:hypothetical protein